MSAVLSFVVGIDVLLLLWVALNTACFGIVVVYQSQDFVPRFLHLFKWGKTDTEQHDSIFYQWTHVPKRWFTHFYIVGVLWCLLLLCEVYIFLSRGSAEGLWALPLLQVLASPDVRALSNPVSLLLALTMLLMQVMRRTLECIFMSVMTGCIHTGHYIVGLLFYLLAGSSLVTPYILATTKESVNLSNVTWYHVTWYHVIATVVFLWANLHQYRCHAILYKLRQKSVSHAIPYGDWFIYVSSPHYFAEILIYVAMVIVHGGVNVYTWLMLLFVIQNLSLGATVTQQWYHAKFRNYPNARFRIIPFLF